MTWSCWGQESGGGPGRKEGEELGEYDKNALYGILKELREYLKQNRRERKKELKSRGSRRDAELCFLEPRTQECLWI